jgi:hypothetical protein
LDTHANYMKSAEFETLPQEVKARFYKHFELTRMAHQAETGPEGESPRVSLQLRGTVGPTTGSKILTQAGVKDVTPEELLEPPLETVVMDNLDKPNAEGEAQNEQGAQLMNKMRESEMLHQQKMRQQAESEVARIGI